LDAIAVYSLGLFANGVAGGGIANTGMIAAGSDGTPIQFAGSGNTLTLEAGYTIGGAVDLRSIGPSTKASPVSARSAATGRSAAAAGRSGGSGCPCPPDEWVSGDEPMTGAQASYLKMLSEECDD
jgi:Protein of unknown function (DUF3072)